MCRRINRTIFSTVPAVIHLGSERQRGGTFGVNRDIQREDEVKILKTLLCEFSYCLSAFQREIYVSLGWSVRILYS